MEKLTRRNFLKILLAGLAGLIGLILGGPLLGFIFEPFYQKRYRRFVRVPGFASLPADKMANLTFEFPENDSFLLQNQVQEVWVIKHAPDRGTVFSPICTHLGCRVNWQGDWQKFVCPCHGSVFNGDGKVVSGPAPRGLDILPSRIEGGELYVQWTLYKAGIAKKVEI